MDLEEFQGGGNGHNTALHFSQPPERVVSLIPSMTESLFDLDLADALVGISDACIHPEKRVNELARVGNPKDPHLEKILHLRPDLVLANWEENTVSTVEALRDAGLAVWVTFPKTVRESVDDLWTLTHLFRSQAAGIRILTLEITLDWAISALSQPRRFRYFCPIWFDETEDGTPYWVTFNQDTYCNDLLELFGGQNIFIDRKRLISGGPETKTMQPFGSSYEDTRYPEVRVEEILAGDPELILLPTEPYPFSETNIGSMFRFFEESSTGNKRRVLFVEGTLITWHGTRLARALSLLPTLLDSGLGL